jgi:hypothetical protein
MLMALLSGVMRFRIGLALSAAGLAGAVLGIYWDPINGRELTTGSIGIIQTLMIAGGAALCVLGAILMVPPRRERPAARAVRPVMKSTADRDKQRPMKKKRRAGGKRRRNQIRR